MKMYVDTDNRLVKEDSKKQSEKNEDKKEHKVSIAESYGLSKNARILCE